MDKATQQTWQDIALLLLRLAVAALFLSAAWDKFFHWSQTMDFLKTTGMGIGLPAWFAALYAFVLPFVEAFIGLAFLTGWCSTIASAVLFFTVASFWVVISRDPTYVGILKDFHVYILLLALTTFSFGFGKYALPCHCCKGK